MINGFEERGLCKENHIKVRKHTGASSTDIIDHGKPVLRKKPDTIIIHVGTEDLTNNINILRNVETISKMAKEESPSTKLCFSSVVNRYGIRSFLTTTVFCGASVLPNPVVLSLLSLATIIK